MELLCDEKPSPIIVFFAIIPRRATGAKFANDILEDPPLSAYMVNRGMGILA